MFLSFFLYLRFFNNFKICSMKLIISMIMISVVFTVAKAQNDGWQKFHDESGIEFYFKKTECHDQQNGIHVEYFLVQVRNTTSYEATIQWNYHQWSDDFCINCKENNTDVKMYQMVLSAGEVSEGNCSNVDEKGMHVFSKFLNYKTQNPVTRIEMNQITINFN